MTESIAERVLDGAMSPATALTYEPGNLINPESAVRQLHVRLPSLGISSPFGAASERLARTDKLAFEATRIDAEATIRRRELVVKIAAGDLSLADAVAGLEAVDLAVPGPEAPGAPGTAARLASETRTAAKATLAGELAAASGHVFDELAKAAADAVASLEALPTPPHGLWVHPDPSILLARADGHEQTLSVVASSHQRFWEATTLAGMVRDAAGHGFERFPDGAPRSAVVYRNWRLTLGDAGRNLNQTRASMRLWRTVVDDWQPGIWKPEDVETQPEDRSFGAKLKQLGQAVTGR